MGKIFWGFLFAFFDYTLTNGAMYINLLPDFVGCLLIGLGLRDLVKKNLPDDGYFAMAANWTVPSVLYSAVLFVLDLIGFSSAHTWFYVVSAIVYLVMIFYVFYWITRGLSAIEYSGSVIIGMDKLNRWWRYMVIFSLLGCVTQVMALFSSSGQIVLAFYICNIAALVCEICYAARLSAANRVLKSFQS